jgi:hypothetical protein
VGCFKRMRMRGRRMESRVGQWRHRGNDGSRASEGDVRLLAVGSPADEERVSASGDGASELQSRAWEGSIEVPARRICGHWHPRRGKMAEKEAARARTMPAWI